LGETTGLRSYDILKAPGYMKGLKQVHIPELKFFPGDEENCRIILRDAKQGKEIKEEIKKKIKKEEEEAKKKAEKVKTGEIDI
jgi:hypothetical protein